MDMKKTPQMFGEYALIGMSSPPVLGGVHKLLDSKRPSPANRLYIVVRNLTTQDSVHVSLSEKQYLSIADHVTKDPRTAFTHTRLRIARDHLREDVAGGGSHANPCRLDPSTALDPKYEREAYPPNDLPVETYLLDDFPLVNGKMQFLMVPTAIYPPTTQMDGTIRQSIAFAYLKGKPGWEPTVVVSQQGTIWNANFRDIKEGVVYAVTNASRSKDFGESTNVSFNLNTAMEVASEEAVDIFNAFMPRETKFLEYCTLIGDTNGVLFDMSKKEVSLSLIPNAEGETKRLVRCTFAMAGHLFLEKEMTTEEFGHLCETDYKSIRNKILKSISVKDIMFEPVSKKILRATTMDGTTVDNDPVSQEPQVKEETVTPPARKRKNGAREPLPPKSSKKQKIAEIPSVPLKKSLSPPPPMISSKMTIAKDKVKKKPESDKHSVLTIDEDADEDDDEQWKRTKKIINKKTKGTNIRKALFKTIESSGDLESSEEEERVDPEEEVEDVDDEEEEEEEIFVESDRSLDEEDNEVQVRNVRKKANTQAAPEPKKGGRAQRAKPAGKWIGVKR